jgi:hypothetical protein
MVMVRVRVRVRVKVRVRVSVRVRFKVKIKVRVKVRFMVKVRFTVRVTCRPLFLMYIPRPSAAILFLFFLTIASQSRNEEVPPKKEEVHAEKG